MDICLIAEATPWWLDLNYYWSVFLVFAGLGFVIFVHELGHFLAAKSCGVKCEKFYIGFDIPLPKIGGFQLPSKLFHFRWGETEYGIGILPLGGYVKMLGQDDDPRKFKEEQERARLHAQDANVEKKPGEPTVAERIQHDPRSYQAKTVPQRMLIISAGVIMNLIFAVIMGAVAYGVGVKYTPTVIGSVSPGYSGWVNDLRPGDHIVQIGKSGRHDAQLRFNQDMIPQIMLNGGEKPLDILIRRGDEEIWKSVQPKDASNIGQKLVGIGSSSTNTFMPKDPVYAFATNFPLSEQLAGATIVEIDGQPIDSFAQVQQVFANHPGKTLKVVIEKPSTGETAEAKAAVPVRSEVELLAQPQQTLGIHFQLGPITAVREFDSPAQRAGLQVGDEVVSIAGQPVGDPFSLSQRMLQHVGQEIDIQIVRPSSDGKTKETMDRKITPTAPFFMDSAGGALPGAMLSVDTLGLAFPVLGKVAAVEPGSPAEKAGLQPGDDVAGFQLAPASDEQKAKIVAALNNSQKLWEQVTLEQSKTNWVSFIDLLQLMPTGCNVDITYSRNNELKTVKVEVVSATAAFQEGRQLRFQPLQQTRIAGSFGEAWALGFRETKEKLNEVFQTLKRLATGKLPPTSLGGPASIFYVAQKEAAQGIPTLLIFLTFLSANLALINFLPIPVLDGGHMVFLAAEGIRGKPLDENMQGWALMVGMVFLLSLMVFVFGLDIQRFITMFT